MAQLFDIKRVTVGPRTLAAVVEVAASAPLLTSEDPQSTALVLDLMPAIAEHACFGDASERFGDVIADTEIAHLLEHVTVELLAQSDVAGDVAAGQTVEVGERTYEITLTCVDDILVAGALSSAAWIMQWAYSGGGDPLPDVDAIVDGLVALVASLDQPPAPEPAPQDEQLAEQDEPLQLPLEPVYAPEPAFEPAPEYLEEPPAGEPTAPAPVAPAPAPAPEPEPAPEPPAPARRTLSRDDWDMDDVPRPRLVR